MVDPDLVEDVTALLAVDRDAFDDRVADESETLKDAIREGAFDNPQGLVGFEYEFYAVRGEDPEARGTPAGALCRIPRRTRSYVGFEKELGLHNAEISTTPQPLNEYGLAGQAAAVRARVAAARRAIVPHDMRFVSDGIWTIPPADESAADYLTDSVTVDGLTIATNMAASPRYHAMANSGLDHGMRIDLPYASLTADTIMPESLTTSIQPHYQVPRTEDFAEYFRYAIRLAGPLLALGVNAPLLPPSLYDDVDPMAAIRGAHHDHRIHVFESVMNGPSLEKVRFPADVDSAADAVDRIVADPTIVPAEVTDQGRFDDAFVHLRHKHGTYWRWVRPVFEGATRSAANARIEFRPLSGQPTVRDAIAFQAAFAGAVSGMTSTMHPLAELEWDRARENFYAAARDGLDAELSWITADGEHTTDPATIFADLFEQAEIGLRNERIADEDVAQYLAPLRHRVEERLTPAAWQLAHARDAIAHGATLSEAVVRAKRAYLRAQDETFLTGSFSTWSSPVGRSRRTAEAA